MQNQNAIKATIFILVCFLWIGHSSYAQVKRSRFELGAGVSAFIYQGDLTPRSQGSMETTKPGILLFANYNLNKKIAVQGSFAWGALKGDDARYARPLWRKFRSLNFQTPVKEFAFKAMYHFYGINGEENRKYAPYVSAGLGLGLLNVKRDATNFDKKYFENEVTVLNGVLTDLSTSPPKKLLLVPVAIGVRKYYTDKISFFGEFNYRFMKNDYLDGFSKAGNPKLGDHFYSISIGAIYKFKKDNSIRCPTY